MPEPLAVVVPRMNPNDDQAVLVAWHIAAGGWVRANATLATLETTKTAFDVQAPAAGYVTYQVAERTMLDVGAAFAWIHAEQPASPTEAPVAEPAIRAGCPAPPAPESQVPASGKRAAEIDGRFTRKALRRMRDLGLTVSDFAGSARVDVEQVELRALEEGHSAATEAVVPSAPPSAPPTDPNVQPLEQSSTKMIEAAALATARASVVPSAVAISCDAARIETRLRQIAASGTVSLLELVIYEAARLLQRYPELNGFFNGRRAYRYETVNVGFAVNLRRSLKVPVIRNAAALSEREIAQRVRDLTLRYLRDELSLEHLVGGTFTVTDLSAQGVVHFVPVLNARQSAILGICAERRSIRERELVLAFDHQMSDGMQAAAFLGELRARLEA